MKINSYINPFSKGFIQTTKDYHFLKKYQKIITVALSALTGLLTLPFLGIGGYATFHALVDAFKPLKKGENLTADKTTSSAQKTFAKGSKAASKGKGKAEKKIDPVQQALAGTADIDAKYSYRDEEGFTALMIALYKEDFESAKKLVERADVNIKSALNKTALSIIINVLYSLKTVEAEAEEMLPAKELFLQILAKSNVETLNLVPLGDACGIDLETVRALVEKGARVNPTEKVPINTAIAERNREIVEYLLDQGAQFGRDDFNTSLGHAVLIDDSASCLEMVALLLDRGADVNERMIFGLTPLLYAIKNNEMELVKLLIRKGADLDLPLSQDLSEFTKETTPLKLAELKGFNEIEKLLLDNGATKRTGRSL